jgi:glycosyltransferase involved in cell wall biosynthesis
MMLIDTSDFQGEWGTTLRMASDFAFVPSFSEAFGLVAAEGLLFGQTVVSSGVGGLAEFLRSKNDEREGNAYLFHIFDNTTSSSSVFDRNLSAERSRPSLEALASGISNCIEAVSKATKEWYNIRDEGKLDKSAVERSLRRLVADALTLEWGRDRGPVEEVSDFIILFMITFLPALALNWTDSSAHHR